MYKDDNIISGGCNDALLRAVLSGGVQGMPSPSPIPKPENGCGTADAGSWGLSAYPLASVYAPLQKFENLYDEKTGLNKGTIFSELDLPFEGRTIKGGNCCG